METSNYFRLCVYFCIGLIIFTLSINFISAMGIFSSVPTDISSTSNNIFSQITGLDEGMASIWAIVTTVGGIGAVVVAFLIQSATFVGVYLFSVVFWTSYSRFIVTININDFIPSDFLIIFTVALLFIWVAAVISMLSNVS